MKLKLKDVCLLNKYPQLDASSLEELRLSSGEIKLLPSSKDYDWASTLEKAKKYICNGEVITLGKARYANIKYHKGLFVSANNIIIESKDQNKVLTKYIYYYCLKNNKKFYVEGTTYPKFDLSSFNNSQISILSFEEQQIIINELDNLFNLISKNEKQLDLYDELIKSRFIEMFGAINIKKALDELTTKITDGSHNPPKGIDKSDYMMLSSQNVYNELILDDVRYLSKEDFDKENKRTDIQNGDVLLTIVGTVGRTYVVKNDEKYVFQRSVGVIKPVKNVLNGIYLSVYLQTPEAINQLESGAHGSSQKGIYLNDLKKLMIPVAEYNKQLEFASFVEQIDKSKFIVQNQIKLLQELLDKKMEEYFG